jgi:hypothetical protein
MKKFACVCLVLISACGEFTPSYDYTSRKLGKNAYEIKLVAMDANMNDLKRILREKGTALCGEGKFSRMRGLREETYNHPPKQVLKGEIECVKY